VILSQLFALSFLPMIAIFPISALQAQMREKDLHVLNLSTALVLIISLYVGVTYFGLLGLIVSRVFVRYVTCIAAFVLLYRK
jgi:O-antigen/teichoic acid export membrane protein